MNRYSRFGRKFLILSWIVGLGLLPETGLIMTAHAQTFFEQHLKEAKKTPSTFKELFDLFPRSGFASGFGGGIGFNGTGPARGLLVPDGRSLQRKFADFEDPRLILAVPEKGGPETFLGHARRSGEVEVISWNPKRAEYQFMLVQVDQKGGPVTVNHPDQKTCLVCHQNGGPILTHFPWAETSFNPQIAEKTNNPFLEMFAPKNGALGSVFLSDGFGMDGSVREANRNLQRSRICKQLCQGDLDCNRKLLYVLLSGPSRNNGVELPQDPRLVEFIENLKSKIPQDGFAFPQSTLPDRDPLASPEKGGKIVVGLDQNHPDAPLIERLINTDDSRSTASIETIINNQFRTGRRAGRNRNNQAVVPSDPNAIQPVVPKPQAILTVYGTDPGSIGNPQTPRAKRGKLSTEDEILTALETSGSVCIVDFSEVISRLAQVNDPAALAKAVFDDKIFDSFLKVSNDKIWPLDGVKMASLLPGHKDQGALLAACGLDERGLPLGLVEKEGQKSIQNVQSFTDQLLASFPKEDLGKVDSTKTSFGPLTANERAQALKDFRSTCGACHGESGVISFSSKNHNFKFDFGNLQHLKDYGNPGGTVPGGQGSNSLLTMLKNRQMPPNPEDVGFTEEQRERMIRLLEEP